MSNIRKNRTNKGCKAIIDAFHKEQDVIEFNVIELCNNYEEREQYWIEELRKQSVYSIVNQFNAVREGASCTDSFRANMSSVLKDRWKDSEYRAKKIAQMRSNPRTAGGLGKSLTMLDPEREIYHFYSSAKDASLGTGYQSVSIAAASRGDFGGKFMYRGRIWIYDTLVLYKLDELLETHQELRAISSLAWEAIKKYHDGSTTNR